MGDLKSCSPIHTWSATLFGKGSKNYMYTSYTLTCYLVNIISCWWLHWAFEYASIFSSHNKQIFILVGKRQTCTYIHEWTISPQWNTWLYIIFLLEYRTTNGSVSLCLADPQAPRDALCQEGEPTKQFQLFSGLQVVPDQHFAICTDTEEQEMGMGLILICDPCHLYSSKWLCIQLVQFHC